MLEAATESATRTFRLFSLQHGAETLGLPRPRWKMDDRICWPKIGQQTWPSSPRLRFCGRLAKERPHPSRKENSCFASIWSKICQLHLVQIHFASQSKSTWLAVWCFGCSTTVLNVPLAPTGNQIAHTAAMEWISSLHFGSPENLTGFKQNGSVHWKSSGAQCSPPWSSLEIILSVPSSIW